MKKGGPSRAPYAVPCFGARSCLGASKQGFKLRENEHRGDGFGARVSPHFSCLRTRKSAKQTSRAGWLTITRQKKKSLWGLQRCCARGALMLQAPNNNCQEERSQESDVHRVHDTGAQHRPPMPQQRQKHTTPNDAAAQQCSTQQQNHDTKKSANNSSTNKLPPQHQQRHQQHIIITQTS